VLLNPQTLWGVVVRLRFWSDWFCLVWWRSPLWSFCWITSDVALPEEELNPLCDDDDDDDDDDDVRHHVISLFFF